MTEYDYSPEAYERYKAKLHSIGRWVHETERFEPANPFIMSPAPTSRSLDHSGSGSDMSSSTFRQVPRRSYTAPHSPQQIYSSQPAAAYQYTPVIPPGHYPSPSPSPGPRRSNTYHAVPPVPPLPPQLQSPKRSLTGGYPASPQVIYDPRVGTASRIIYSQQQAYQYHPQSSSSPKRWLGKLFSGLRSASPVSSGNSSPVSSRHSRSKSAHHSGSHGYYYDRDRERERDKDKDKERDRDRDRDRYRDRDRDKDRDRNRNRDRDRDHRDRDQRSKSHSRTTSRRKHHKSRSSSL